MNHTALITKAISLRGALAPLRQITGRRFRDDNGDDPFELLCPFAADEAKLLCSKSWRTLGEKTQVFSYATGHTRNRMTHVNEVVACAVIISEMLGLNTNLVRAAAIGHDIGHVPLGHQGEAWMAKMMDKPFCHEVFGVIKAQRIERAGHGLNLTWETLQAMMRHSGNLAIDSMSQEAWVLRYADKIAYIFHDINDIGQRLGFKFSLELQNLIDDFGSNQRERTTTAMAALVIESVEKGHVSFKDSALAQKFDKIRTLMYRVYPQVSQQDVGSILGPIIDWLNTLDHGDAFLLLALMTDKDIEMLSGRTMKDYGVLQKTSIFEVLEYLPVIGPIDMCEPGLNW